MEQINTDIKDSIKSYWEKYKVSYSGVDEKLIADIVSEWENYKELLRKDEFKLLNYTNLRNDGTKTNDYLCHFLETKSKCLGSSRPAFANQFGIYHQKENQGEKKYRKADYKDKHLYTEDEVEKEFNDIRKLLKIVCTDNEDNDLNDKIKEIEEQSTIPAKQILRKLLVLEHPSEFIQIYQDKALENLYNHLKLGNDEEEKITPTQMNSEITQWFVDNIEKLDVDTKNPKVSALKKMSLVSNFLWELSQEYDMFSSSKNIILYGAPGTGKTYKIEKFMQQQQMRGNICEKIQFHPSYSYEDFIEGFKPSGLDKNGNMKFELVNGHFKDFCIKALKAETKRINNLKKKIEHLKSENKSVRDIRNLEAKIQDQTKYFFIIDEINRANLSAVFGELLYCLEYRYNKDSAKSNLIKTQYASVIKNLPEDEKEDKVFIIDDGEVKFGIPDNVYIIGMMNDVDRSIDTFDLALRRRFKWIRMECDYDVIRNILDFENAEDYAKVCENLNDYISKDLNLGKSYEFGHSFFLKIQDIPKRNKKNISNTMMESLFKDYLESTLREYLRANFTEQELESKLNDAKKKFKLTDKSSNDLENKVKK